MLMRDYIIITKRCPTKNSRPRELLTFIIFDNSLFLSTDRTAEVHPRTRKVTKQKTRDHPTDAMHRNHNGSLTLHAPTTLMPFTDYDELRSLSRNSRTRTRPFTTSPSSFPLLHSTSDLTAPTYPYHPELPKPVVSSAFTSTSTVTIIT